MLYWKYLKRIMWKNIKWSCVFETFYLHNYNIKRKNDGIDRSSIVWIIIIKIYKNEFRVLFQEPIQDQTLVKNTFPKITTHWFLWKGTKFVASYNVFRILLDKFLISYSESNVVNAVCNRYFRSILNSCIVNINTVTTTRIKFFTSIFFGMHHE